MRRRDFIKGIVGATAWPFAVQAQQAPMPVIGFLDVRSPEAMGDRLVTFRQGLRETGFVEGENVAIAYRWAENRTDRLPELAADLVRLKAAVIATVGVPAAFAARRQRPRFQASLWLPKNARSVYEGTATGSTLFGTSFFVRC